MFLIIHLIKDLYPEHNKKFSQLNDKKTGNPIQKWAKYLNKHFTKEYIRIVNYNKRLEI
jgi:hypothetical protein